MRRVRLVARVGNLAAVQGKAEAREFGAVAGVYCRVLPCRQLLYQSNLSWLHATTRRRPAATSSGSSCSHKCGEASSSPPSCSWRLCPRINCSSSTPPHTSRRLRRPSQHPSPPPWAWRQLPAVAWLLLLLMQLRRRQQRQQQQGILARLHQRRNSSNSSNSCRTCSSHHLSCPHQRAATAEAAWHRPPRCPHRRRYPLA